MQIATWKFVSLVATFLLSATAISAQTSRETAEREIKAQIAKLVKLHGSKGLAAYMTFFTPDYTCQSGQRHYSRAQFAASVSKLFASEKPGTVYNTQVHVLTTHGDEATVQVKDTATQSMPHNGGSYKASTEETVRDVWVKTSAGWKVRRSEMLAYTTKGEWVQDAAGQHVLLHRSR